MYQPLRYPKSFKATWQIAVTTVFFVVIAAIVSALVAHAIFEMRSSADQIDDSRARRAAVAAIISAKEKLSATVKDKRRLGRRVLRNGCRWRSKMGL